MSSAAADSSGAKRRRGMISLLVESAAIILLRGRLGKPGGFAAYGPSRRECFAPTGLRVKKDIVNDTRTQGKGAQTDEA
jgi:hypothetical protein